MLEQGYQSGNSWIEKFWAIANSIRSACQLQPAWKVDRTDVSKECYNLVSSSPISGKETTGALLKSQVRVALTNCNIRVHLHELCPQEFNWPRLQLWYCPIFLFPFTLQKARRYHAFSMFQFPHFLDAVFAAVRWLGRSIWAIKNRWVWEDWCDRIKPKTMTGLLDRIYCTQCTRSW